jgi:outer membrane protein assembly factor BamB
MLKIRRQNRPWFFAPAVAAMVSSLPLRGDDWPQWRGPARDGVWRESGILKSFPSTGLETRWRAKVGLGYSGPVVAEGRVYVTDRQTDPKEVERVLCFDEQTGQSLWTHAYPCNYRHIGYRSGPRAAPIVDQGKVYTLGATGYLCCLDAAKGKVLWEKDLAEEYRATPPRWGISAAPLLEGDLLIVCAGADNGSVMAFKKDTGELKWRALDDRPTYSAPIAITFAGKRQVIVWTGDAVASLDPVNGKTYWRIPYKLAGRSPIAVATPVLWDDLLLLVSFETGATLLKLDSAKPAASVVWEDKRGPTSLMGTPLFRDGYFYVTDNYGEFQCRDAREGKLVWGTRKPTGETKWGESVHLTPNGDRVLLLNPKGELILAKLSQEGYHEMSRVRLIEPTVGAKEEGAVAWAHPAYANKHIFVRNDKELIRASLAAAGRR